MLSEDVLAAIGAALAGDWRRAHELVQRDETDPMPTRPTRLE
jgi:hypothetical protein